jgi:hypothetical protein
VCTQSGGSHDYATEPPFARLQLALTRPHEMAGERIQYEFVRLGPEDVVLTVDGEVAWRGSDEMASNFENSVIQPVLALFLSQSGS